MRICGWNPPLAHLTCSFFHATGPPLCSWPPESRRLIVPIGLANSAQLLYSVEQLAVPTSGRYLLGPPSGALTGTHFQASGEDKPSLLTRFQLPSVAVLGNNPSTPCSVHLSLFFLFSSWFTHGGFSSCYFLPLLFPLSLFPFFLCNTEAGALLPSPSLLSFAETGEVNQKSSECARGRPAAQLVECLPGIQEALGSIYNPA